jgi:hypothetical protein
MNVPYCNDKYLVFYKVYLYSVLYCTLFTEEETAEAFFVIVPVKKIAYGRFSSIKTISLLILLMNLFPTFFLNAKIIADA